MVPSEWLNKSIGDNIDLSGGAQPPRDTFKFEPAEGYIRLIQIRDYKTDKFLTYVPKDLARKFCTKEDVMIGRYGPPIFQILRGIEGAYNVALIKATPKKNVDREYMYYFLKRDPLLHVIESYSQRTSGQTGIEMDVLKAYPMPLPPPRTTKNSPHPLHLGQGHCQYRKAHRQQQAAEKSPDATTAHGEKTLSWI